MRIVLDGASTRDGNDRNDTCSKPTVLEVGYDPDRDDGTNILWRLRAELERAEIENGYVTLTTWMTVAESASVLSKLVIFGTPTGAEDEDND